MAVTQEALYGRLDLALSWSESDLPERERTKHVHRLHPYLGKFVPQLVEELLGRYVRHRGRVLDPFAGSGTTLVQALDDRRWLPGTGAEGTPAGEVEDQRAEGQAERRAQRAVDHAERKAAGEYHHDRPGYAGGHGQGQEADVGRPAEYRMGGDLRVPACLVGKQVMRVQPVQRTRGDERHAKRHQGKQGQGGTQSAQQGLRVQ